MELILVTGLILGFFIILFAMFLVTVVASAIADPAFNICKKPAMISKESVRKMEYIRRFAAGGFRFIE